MQSKPHVTRFAPSPTGSLHLGNARTALFNMLAARAGGGRFVLRIEDTDAARSDERVIGMLLRDLAWLGLVWDEGPDIGGPHAPYRQSERAATHEAAVARLRKLGFTYPCFCSNEELEFTRRAQLAAGKPPRYSGKCAALETQDAARRIAAGERAACRFRVPGGRVLEFDDLIHGAQRFATDDIGDFVVQRADGTVAFLLGNAVDDAEMGITLVLRGDDHLANTPRQMLLMEALGVSAPSYGHLPLVVGATGRPLSKREGAASLADLREQGYLPGAICNYLVRLGHVCGTDDWVEPLRLCAGFDLSRTSRSSAHFDPAQLRHWQREAITRSSVDDLAAWLGARLEPVPVQARPKFIEAARGNILFPADSERLVEIVTAEDLTPSPDALAGIAGAARGFFREALKTRADAGADFRRWTRSLATATGTSGAALYRPLRAALTGETHGPELASLVALMGPARVRIRLERAAAVQDQCTR